MYADSKLTRSGEFEYSLNQLTRKEMQVLHDVCKVVYMPDTKDNEMDNVLARIMKVIKQEFDLTKQENP